MTKPPRLDLLPSAADRWFTCAASPRFCLENADLLPLDTSSKFSLEGTTAHEVAAAFLQDREPNPENCPTPITPEMRLHGFQYMEYVLALRSEANPGVSKLIVEQKQPLFYYEGRNAVVDAAVINPESLHIVDYKYGQGVAVSPIENLQTTIYAYQIALPLNLPLDFPVYSHIYQPRCRDNGGEPAHVWETNLGTIATLAGEIAAKADLIRINNDSKGAMPAFVPSEKACRWCPAKGICPVYMQEAIADFEVLKPFDDEPKQLPAVQALPIERVSMILKHKKKIIKWLDGLEEYATERMREGFQIPGHKLVLSKGGHRFWTDEKKAAELLVKSTVLKRSEVVEESVKSPAAIEKLIGKKKFSAELTALIAKPPGSPVIAPADDNREEYLLKAENEFSVLSEEQLDRLDDY